MAKQPVKTTAPKEPANNAGSADQSITKESTNNAGSADQSTTTTESSSGTADKSLESTPTNPVAVNVLKLRLKTKSHPYRRAGFIFQNDQWHEIELPATDETVAKVTKWYADPNITTQCWYGEKWQTLDAKSDDYQEFLEGVAPSEPE